MVHSKLPASAGKYLQICILTLLVNFYCVSHTEAGLPFGASVFPLLTSGWYPKPAPKEALLLGIALVNILALKFAASAAGVPYHLNDIKLDHFFDKKYFRRGKRSNSILAPLSNPQVMSTVIQGEELAILERVLLALRRIDSHDCFIRHICQASQNRLIQNATTFSDFAFDDFWIDLFRLRPKQKRSEVNYDEPSVWSIYEEALKPQRMDCNKKYDQCPLTEKDLTKTSLLSTLF